MRYFDRQDHDDPEGVLEGRPTSALIRALGNVRLPGIPTNRT